MGILINRKIPTEFIESWVKALKGRCVYFHEWKHQIRFAMTGRKRFISLILGSSSIRGSF